MFFSKIKGMFPKILDTKNLYCFVCKNYGHLSCPKNDLNKSSKSISCCLCGNVNNPHYFKKCSKFNNIFI
jgi:hypothetical protein